MATQWTVSCLAMGLPGGQNINETYTITGSNVVGETLYATLASGDNTFTIPTGAISVGIVPPNTNAQALKVRTNLDVTGIQISETDPFGPFCWRGLSPTSLVINAGGTVTGVQITFLG